MIDKAGTPFDQAALMMALLNQAGFAANYQAGTVTMNGTDFAAWTGISDATAACQLLSSGGIPAQVNGTTIANCAYGTNTAVTTVTLAHIWIQANIPTSSCGANCLFDPSFKRHVLKPSAAVTATGFQATVPFTTATNTMGSGTWPSDSTLHYVNGFERERVGIAAQLLCRQL